jgi:hypothetical protein
LVFEIKVAPMLAIVLKTWHGHMVRYTYNMFIAGRAM